jgi:pimeloyl-ACP methyl ester carboxylesterase
MQQPNTSEFDSPLRHTSSTPAIAYRVRSGGPEVVVLLHGVGSSSATWTELAPLIDARYTLLMPDYRGHGASDAPAPPYSVDDFVGDLYGLVDELGITGFHLVGFSIGAIFAQAAAEAQPDRVFSLVLLNSIADRSEAERTRALERLAHIRRTDPAEVADGSIERWFTPAFAEANPELVGAEVEIVAANRSEPYAAAYEVLATTDLIEQAGRILCPVLLVTGEKDRGSTPRMSEAIHARIPGSELVVVPELQHYLHIEAPELIAGLINGFLESHPAPHL